MAMHLNNHHMITNIRNGGKNEGHFFDHNKEASMSSLSPDIKNLDERPIVMEFTPNYLSEDTVPRIIRALYTDEEASKLKFIVALREPVSRAISSYLYKKNSHPKLPSFVESMEEGFRNGKCVSSCYEKARKKKGSTGTHVDNFRRCEIGQCVERIMSAHVVKSM